MNKENERQEMVQKLLRVTDEPTRHKILDLLFLGAIGIGAINAITALRAISASAETDIGLYLLFVQMSIFAICGAIGYLGHVALKVWWEFSSLIPIILGYAFVAAGSFIAQTNAPLAYPLVIGMGGILPSVGIWFIVDACARFHQINTRRKQLRSSAHARDMASIKIDARKVIAEADKKENDNENLPNGLQR